MSSQFPRKRSHRATRSVCGESGEEDGQDPRRFFRRGSDRRQNRKDLQLCEQVAHTLQYVLSGSTGDDDLRDLVVVRVVPAPNGGRLMVFVAASTGHDGPAADEIAARLAAMRPRLRAEIAESITRRKVPDLSFQVVAADPPPERKDGAT